MKISKKAWSSFVGRLQRINDQAAEKVASFVDSRGGIENIDRKVLLDYAYFVATRYGEGATEMACQMYDAIARLSGKKVPPAVPAKTATYQEVAKSVNGALLYSPTGKSAGAAVGRMVKMAGVDTTMQNAIRDGAEWAWIPSGDSCAFCDTLASQGWQKASKDVLNGGHAEHIHNNCNCTFAVRFNESTTVAGYDPEALRKKYYAADGLRSKDKINAMRREIYAANKDKINEQKRAAYAARMERVAEEAAK